VFFVSVASKRLRVYVSPLVATYTPQFVSVVSKGLRSLHNCRSGTAFLAMGWGCGCFAGVRISRRKSGGKPPHSKVSAAAASGANCGENCGGGICDPGMKKSGRATAAIGKSPRSYPESTVPDDTQRVKNFWVVGIFAEAQHSLPLQNDSYC